MVDIKAIYSSCDVFLKMSSVEGSFCPPMEAMACGCAVVVGKATEYDEVIWDGYSALVYEWVSRCGVAYLLFPLKRF